MLIYLELIPNRNSMNLNKITKGTNTRGTAVSLYTGAGGMDLGFFLAGYDIVWSNDINADAVKTYQSVFKSHESTCGDIINQTLPEIKDLDLVIGGPPCQGFSVAGKMDPNDPRSQHVWNFLGVVKKLKPQSFVMENVKALGYYTRWSKLKESLVKSAEELGYKTRIYVLNAANYGVPQARERMFLVGTKVGTEKPIIPSEVSESEKRVLNDVIKELPRYGKAGNDIKCTAIITPAKNPVLRKSPFAGMLFNGQGRPLNIKTPSLTLPASMGGNRTPILDQRQIDENKEPWVIDYHRKLTNGMSPVKKVPPYLRRLTVQEAAAIQTFPKDMEFYGSITSKFNQIGNAVPPLLAYHVAMSL